MQQLTLYQIDAFTDEAFGGNPAAVVPLPDWPDAPLLQSIAAENNLSETAFFVRTGDQFALRWFTPTREVPLCGHATLAAAHVIFTALDPSRDTVMFDTQSGELSVRRNGEWMTMSLPFKSPLPCETPPLLLDALNVEPNEVRSVESDPNYYVVLETEGDVHATAPNLSILEQLHPYGVAVTAPGHESDFVSRYFAPSYGISEDPVTGSIHAALTPYWVDRLGMQPLRARQLSERGGTLQCKRENKSVEISGQAVRVLEGTLFL